MNNELERIWKEAVLAKFEALSWCLPTGTEEAREGFVRVAGLRAKI